jgi:peptidyl-prolyl cis-trans isomerase SurA
VTRAAAALAILLCLAATRAAADQIDGVAAIVDDSVVLESEVDLASALLLQRVQRNGEPIPIEIRKQARVEALKGLIEARLILSFAERRDLAATPEEIDRAISGIADDEGISVEAVYQSAATQGLGREQYRTELRNQITRMKVLQNVVRARITIED